MFILCVYLAVVLLSVLSAMGCLRSEMAKLTRRIDNLTRLTEACAQKPSTGDRVKELLSQLLNCSRDQAGTSAHSQTLSPQLSHFLSSLCLLPPRAPPTTSTVQRSLNVCVRACVRVRVCIADSDTVSGSLQTPAHLEAKPELSLVS